MSANNGADDESVPRVEEERFLRGYDGRLLVVFSTGTMAALTGQFVLSPLLPAIIEDLSISPSRAGLALSVLFGAAALSHYPGGKFAEKLSRKTVLVGSLLVLLFGAIQLIGTPSYALLLLGVGSFGVGLGLYQTAGLVMISDLYDRRRGLAYGLNSAALNLGGVISGLLATAAVAAFTWRAAFVPIVAVLAGVLLLMHRWNAEPYQLSVPPLELRPTIKALAADRHVALTIAVFAAFSFTFQGSISFFPTLLITEKAFPPQLARLAFTGIFIVSMGSNLVSGRLGDHAGYLLVGAATILSTLLGILIVLLAGSTATIVSGILLFGIGSSGFWPVMFSHLIEELPNTKRGGAFGASRMLFSLVGSLGSTYVGIVAEQVSYGAAYAGLLVCLLFGLGVVLWLLRG